MTERKRNRKQHILQNLALMLEQELTDRITTAKLAKKVGVSEAALYRHFPSKARMYESLLDFSEESIFSRINQIKADAMSAQEKLNKISFLVLGFCQKNPGLCRLLNGEVLLGETQRLKDRISQFFDRIELELKQVHREDSIKNKQSTENSANIARFLASMIEGRIQQFVRSRFKMDPTSQWDNQWQMILKGIE
ncbi:MAG: nucleoid occlusion factor SlmA [Enterobacterales bacterium]|nr:nucleoid occlusion factor SlmA [Enterobacterales bacterium]